MARLRLASPDLGGVRSGPGFRMVERWVTIERSEEPDRVAADRRHGPALDLIQPRSISASSERTITLDDDSPMTDGMTRPCGIHPQGEKRGTLRQRRINRSIRVLRRRQQAGTSVDSPTVFNKRGERFGRRVVGCRIPKQPGPLGSPPSVDLGRVGGAEDYDGRRLQRHFYLMFC